jgi:uncharacterized protein YbjT (DUF2867 family)
LLALCRFLSSDDRLVAICAIGSHAVIAVMGAAGRVGGRVADVLLEKGEHIRVLQHGRPLAELAARRAEVVQGDAANVDDLVELFDAAAAALVLLPDNVAEARFVAQRSTIARSIADALTRRPVRHVVMLSSLGVDRPDVVGIPAGLRELEQLLFALEAVNVLALRSALYIDYLLMSVPLIQAQGINGSAIEGDRPLPMIATSDVAAEAAERLARRDFSGHQAKLLLGPEDVTMREATAEIGQRVGKPEVRYIEFPPDDLERTLTGAGFSKEAASKLVEQQLAVNEGRFDAGVERTSENTGSTTLDDFLAGALAPAAG